METIHMTEEQLSDLDIVQRALEITGGTLEVSPTGDWLIKESSGAFMATGYDVKSLLTWAKQTLGIEG